MPRAVYATVKKEKGLVIIEAPYSDGFKENIKSRTKTWEWNGKYWTVDISEKSLIISLIKVHYRDCPAFIIEGAVATDIHTGEIC